MTGSLLLVLIVDSLRRLAYGRNITDDIQWMSTGMARSTREPLMARQGKDTKQGTGRRIVEAAGHRLKRDGIDGSGVSTLMADAGLTNGAFYAHFGSKEDL